METETASLEFGGSRLSLAPLEPAIWQPLAAGEPGLARLCLTLLTRSPLRWQGVIGAGPNGGDGWARAGESELARLPAAVLEPLLSALCAPWLTTQEEADLGRFEAYVRSVRDYPGLSCAACAEQEQRGEGAPDCAACPRQTVPAGAGAALAWAGLLAELPEPAWGLPLYALKEATPRELRLLYMRLAKVWAQRRGPSPG